MKRERQERRNKHKQKYTNNNGAHDNFIVNDDIEDEISSIQNKLPPKKFFYLKFFRCFLFILFLVVPSAGCYFG